MYPTPRLLSFHGYKVFGYHFSDDPKYNGDHVCPRCGNRSDWNSTETKTTENEQSSIMITVECSGECQHYVMAYETLRKFPHFKELGLHEGASLH